MAVQWPGLRADLQASGVDPNPWLLAQQALTRGFGGPKDTLDALVGQAQAFLNGTPPPTSSSSPPRSGDSGSAADSGAMTGSGTTGGFSSPTTGQAQAATGVGPTPSQISNIGGLPATVVAALNAAGVTLPAAAAAATGPLGQGATLFGGLVGASNAIADARGIPSNTTIAAMNPMIDEDLGTTMYGGSYAGNQAALNAAIAQATNALAEGDQATTGRLTATVPGVGRALGGLNSGVFADPTTATGYGFGQYGGPTARGVDAPTSPLSETNFASPRASYQDPELGDIPATETGGLLSDTEAAQLDAALAAAYAEASGVGPSGGAGVSGGVPGGGPGGPSGEGPGVASSGAKKGGPIPKTGKVLVHKGEYVVRDGPAMRYRDVLEAINHDDLYQALALLQGRGA